MSKVIPIMPRGSGKSSFFNFNRPTLVLTRTDMEGTYFLVYSDRIETEDPKDNFLRTSIKLSPEDFDKYLAKAKLTGQYAKVYKPLILAYEAKLTAIFLDSAKTTHSHANVMIDESSDMVDAMTYAAIMDKNTPNKLKEIKFHYHTGENE